MIVITISIALQINGLISILISILLSSDLYDRDPVMQELIISERSVAIFQIIVSEIL